LPPPLTKVVKCRIPDLQHRIQTNTRNIPDPNARLTGSLLRRMRGTTFGEYNNSHQQYKSGNHQVKVA
ncbi:MAG: hypothetical protein ACKOAR_12875, partial [Bacteroidota bacterium]